MVPKSPGPAARSFVVAALAALCGVVPSLFQYGDEPEPGEAREVRPEPGAGGS